MTPALWVIGIIAVLWPVVMCAVLEHRITNWVEQLTSYSENKKVAEAREVQTIEQLTSLQEYVAQQDRLIAALWYDRFGLDDDHDELKTHLGIRPNWYGHRPEWAGPIAYLTKYDRYPWGQPVDSLYTSQG